MEHDFVQDAAVGNGVIVLSSDDEDCFLPQDILKVAQPLKKVSFVEEVSNSESLQSPRRSLRKRKGKNAAKSSIENGPSTPKTAGGIQTDLEKYLSSEVTCASTPPSHRKKCPYCSIDSPEYPPVKVKIMPVRGKKKDELSQVLSMEIGAKTDNIASDYWGFVELTSKSYDLDFAPPRQRDLLPFEALRILKKIPEDSIGCLGMHKSVARPEALVMERVPVPPICTRTPDMKYVSNTTSVRFGTDRATRSLQTLVNEVARIRSTRSGKPTWRAGRDEFKLLQSITANYFRERGAPKVYIYVFIFSALVAEIVYLFFACSPFHGWT
jgi:DNA-directed RNA polymerase beta' subunit